VESKEVEGQSEGTQSRIFLNRITILIVIYYFEMKIIDKYLCLKFIASFFYCIIAFLGLRLIIDLSGRLYFLVSHNVPYSIITRYYLSIIPHEAVRLMPISLLLSTLHNLGQLSRFNEYTAIKASGISLYRMVAPFLAIAFLVSILSFAFNEYLVPSTWSTALKLKEQYISPKKNTGKGAQFNLLYYGSEGRIFFIQTVNEKGTILKGIQILQEDNHGRIIWRLDSRYAEWAEEGWRFYDGIIREFGALGEIKNERPFTEKMLDIKEKPLYFSRRQPSPEEMSFRELSRHIKLLEKRNQKPAHEKVSLHNKISFPLMNFIIIFLGIPFALVSPRTSGLMIGLALSLGISFIYYTIASLGNALGNTGLLPPVIASWLGNGLTFIGGLILLRRVKK
jgi:lipopolysaccharide export system permease protein